jgi:hypothetical protein
LGFNSLWVSRSVTQSLLRFRRAEERVASGAEAAAQRVAEIAQESELQLAATTAEATKGAYAEVLRVRQLLTVSPAVAIEAPCSPFCQMSAVLGPTAPQCATACGRRKWSRHARRRGRRRR